MPDEVAEEVIFLGAGTLTFEDLEQHTGLVDGVSREDFGLLGQDGGAALDECGHDTTSSFNCGCTGRVSLQ